MRTKFKEGIYRHKSRWLILLGLLGLVVISPIGDTFAQDVSSQNEQVYLPFVSAQTGISNSTDEHDHLGHIPENGRFTTNDGSTLSWPPQVKYIDETVWDKSMDAGIIRSANLASAALATTIQNVEIQELLGERYTFISAHPIKQKWDDTVFGERVTYFSYSNNITIEAVLENGALESVETFAAADNQPALRQNEVDAAIEIARQYWLAKGNTRVNELQGFTIQTFKTEGDGGFYDTRMTYVSFHLDEVSEPELLTWVDLTTETVFRAAIDDGGVQYEQ